MDKMKMMSRDGVQANIEKIRELFPNCVTEVLRDGKVTLAVDFDMLRQEMSDTLIDDKEERYQFTWPDKKASIRLANQPINKTLRPCREESVDFDTTENLYIEGDNLEVLKLLQETYHGKINLVYIDPPYNTGNDIIYKNNYYEEENDYVDKYAKDEFGNMIFANIETDGRFHSNWLNMMYSRIKLAKDMLSDEGFFITAIDHNELFNLGSICDEVFGYGNRIAVITVVHKPEGRNQTKFIGPSNEFMLVYAKNANNAKLNKVVLNTDKKEEYEYEDEKGKYKLKNFIRLSDGKYATRDAKPAFWYPIYISENMQKISLSYFDNSFAVYPITSAGVERTWKTTKETFFDRWIAGDIIVKKEGKTYVVYEKLREEEVIKTHWINKNYHGYHFGTKVLDELLQVKTFDFPKSIYLMKDIFKLFSSSNGIVLDFFSGSATSAHALMQLNAESDSKRKFIMVQAPVLCDAKTEAYKAGYKNICEIGKERIRRAGKKIKDESPLTTADLDIGFRVLKVDESNMKDVYYTTDKYNKSLLDSLEDNIKEDRTPLDLLFQVMLDLGVTLSSSIEETEIAGKKVYNVAGNYLLASFDNDLTEEVITTIAQQKPVYFVMRDSSMANDSVSTNFDQIFKTYSPDTIRKVL